MNQEALGRFRKSEGLSDLLTRAGEYLGVPRSQLEAARRGEPVPPEYVAQIRVLREVFGGIIHVDD